MRAWFGGLRDERGSHLPELAMAMLVLSVVIMGVAAAMASSLAYVGGARQRSVGTAVATEQLENLQNLAAAPDLDFGAIALAGDVPPSSDDDPLIDGDHEKCGGEPGDHCYVEGGVAERLLVGGVIPYEEPEDTVVGTTSFTIRHYVTCPPQEHSCDRQVAEDEDGNEFVFYEPHYRRVVAVVRWNFPVNAGPMDRVTQSTLITPGAITVESTDEEDGAGGTTTEPPEKPNLVDTCAEASPPTGSIEVVSGSEGGFHNSPNVQVRLEVTDPCPMVLAEMRQVKVEGEEVVETEWAYIACWEDVLPDPEEPGCETRSDAGDWEPVTVAWQIDPEEATYFIHVRFENEAAQSEVYESTQIVLDTGPPTKPEDFRMVSLSCPPGPDRFVRFTWEDSSDSGDPENPGLGNLVGYRLYQSIDAGSFQVVAEVGWDELEVAPETHKRNHRSVRFFVRAYDKAGNESVSSDVISLSRNECDL